MQTAFELQAINDDSQVCVAPLISRTKLLDKKETEIVTTSTHNFFIPRLNDTNVERKRNIIIVPVNQAAYQLCNHTRLFGDKTPTNFHNDIYAAQIIVESSFRFSLLCAFDRVTSIITDSAYFNSTLFIRALANDAEAEIV